MAAKRQRFSAEVKSKIALEAVKNGKTLQEIASAHNVHPNQVSDWKKQLQDNASTLFDKPNKHIAHDTRIESRLYEEIGRLKCELDWLKKKL
jgi:transposase-like protein